MTTILSYLFAASIISSNGKGRNERIRVPPKLPYDETFTRAMIKGQTIIECNDSNLIPILTNSWDKIKKIILNN